MPVNQNDPLNSLAPTLGGTWENGVWHQSATDDPNSQAYQNYQHEMASYNAEKNDPNSPYNQANKLGAQEQMLLGRQAPAISQVFSTGLANARGNQMGALGAQQQLMAGPSLAGMRAQQAFGQQQQQLMAARNPMAMRQAMLGGVNQLGQAAQQTGGAVGQEWQQGQQGIANSINTLGQGDVASQQALLALQGKQQQLYLNQRQQNLGAAQGYEQNYYDLQNAYTQAAQAAVAAKYQQAQQQQQLQNQLIGASMSAVATGGTTLGNVSNAASSGGK